MRPAAAGRPWIWLSVVMHELGHVLGFDHDDAGAIPVMNGTLDAGAHYQLGTAGNTAASLGLAGFFTGADIAQQVIDQQSSDASIVTPLAKSALTDGLGFFTSSIVVRAISLLDYTVDAADVTGAAAILQVAANDNGDAIYAQVGNDVVFGEGQDDAIAGGYGNDRISVGTGDDGVLGDGGRIYTYRVSGAYGEPLYGLAPFAASDLSLFINSPGKIQQATINVPGELIKAVNLTPYSLDPTPGEAGDNMTYRPSNSDDIIYGGLGNDFLRGGADDDLVSGAEALVKSYIGYFEPNNPDPVGVERSDYTRPFDAGNALAYGDRLCRRVRRVSGICADGPDRPAGQPPLLLQLRRRSRARPQAPTAQACRSTRMETTACSATAATTGSLAARARITPLADGTTTSSIWTMTRSRRAVSTTSPTPPRPTRTSPMAARAVMF